MINPVLEICLFHRTSIQSEWDWFTVWFIWQKQLNQMGELCLVECLSCVGYCANVSLKPTSDLPLNFGSWVLACVLFYLPLLWLIILSIPSVWYKDSAQTWVLRCCRAIFSDMQKSFTKSLNCAYMHIISEL